MIGGRFCFGAATVKKVPWAKAPRLPGCLPRAEARC
jgi:hypothetical protein